MIFLELKMIFLELKPKPKYWTKNCWTSNANLNDKPKPLKFKEDELLKLSRPTSVWVWGMTIHYHTILLKFQIYISTMNYNGECMIVEFLIKYQNWLIFSPTIYFSIEKIGLKRVCRHLRQLIKSLNMLNLTINLL